jgi:hypothetical protein
MSEARSEPRVARFWELAAIHPSEAELEAKRRDGVAAFGGAGGGTSATVSG